jgi:hypothetical protein
VFFALVAIGAAAGGHGTYHAARLLFPYTMVLSRGRGITAPLMTLAMLQYPAYSVAVAKARKGLVPAPLKLGMNRLRWRAEDVRKYLKPRWTLQNRPLVDVSKPATTG